MEYIISGLVLGLMGSFHCIGMCGPLVIALPLRGNNYFQKIAGGIIYNLGRTLTYAGMGAIFGFVGQGLQMVGFQQWVSVIMGSFMIILVLFPSIFKNKLKINSSIFNFVGKLKASLHKLFTQKSYGTLFLIGILNGFLPCGLVYIAIAGAIGTGSIIMGIIFMLVFGLGTIPIMLSISLLGNLVSVKIRAGINKFIPAVVIFVGILFILSGLNLGIPFFSPKKEVIKQKFENELQKQQKEDTPKIIEEIPSCCSK